MNSFIKKMLEYGSELELSASDIESSIIVNDAEILYNKHIRTLSLAITSFESLSDTERVIVMDGFNRVTGKKN